MIYESEHYRADNANWATGKLHTVGTCMTLLATFKGIPDDELAASEPDWESVVREDKNSVPADKEQNLECTMVDMIELDKDVIPNHS